MDKNYWRPVRLARSAAKAAVTRPRLESPRELLILTLADTFFITAATQCIRKVGQRRTGRYCQ